MTIPFIKTLVGRSVGHIPHRLPLLPPPSSVTQLIPIPPPNTPTAQRQETALTLKLNPANVAIHAPLFRSILSFNTTIHPTMRQPRTSTISNGRWVPLYQPQYEFPFEFVSTPFSEMLYATFFGGDEQDKSFEDIIRVNNAIVDEVLMCNVINRAYRLNNQPKFSNVPNNTKFGKQLKGRMKGISHRGNFIAFGMYALQALEHARITAKQIEAGRRAILRIARGGKIWVRIFADKPVTKRPAETRMGRGKGSVAYWAAVVQPGRLLYEIGGVTENIARQAISLASSKMHIRTRFIVSGSK